MKVKEEDLRRELLKAISGEDLIINCARRLGIRLSNFKCRLYTARIHGIESVLHSNRPGGYSDDLKLEVVSSLMKGMAKHAAARTYNISEPTLNVWLRKHAEGGQEALLEDNRTLEAKDKLNRQLNAEAKEAAFKDGRNPDDVGHRQTDNADSKAAILSSNEKIQNAVMARKELSDILSIGDPSLMRTRLEEWSKLYLSVGISHLTRFTRTHSFKGHLPHQQRENRGCEQLHKSSEEKCLRLPGLRLFRLSDLGADP